MNDDGIEKLGPRLFRVRVQGRDRRTGAKVSRQETVEGPRSLARKRRDALRAAVREEGRKSKRVKLAAYASSWLAVRKGNLKPSVALKYATSLDLHILPRLGEMYLDALVSADVQGYVNERVAKVGVKGGNTVLNELRLLRTIAGDSHAEGLAPRDWADRVKPPEVREYTEDNPNLLSAAELATLLAAIPAQWLPLVTLMAFTGLRWGEASALKWGDLDHTKGVIRVRRANWKGLELTPKTKKSRRPVPMPPGMVARPDLAEVYIFPTKRGTLHKGTPLKKVLDKACKAAGVPRVTSHGLRRSFNNLLRQVADLLVTRSIIGHADQAMTEHYSRVGHDEMRAAAQRVIDLVTTTPAKQLPDGAGTERDDEDAK